MTGILYDGDVGRIARNGSGEDELKIALCDDEEEALNSLKKLIESYCANKELQADLCCFSSGAEFLQSGVDFSIVFMDVYLNGVKGTDVIRTARKERRFPVVFTTVSKEFAVEAFSLNAMHYLTKPVTAEGVNEAMSRCLLYLKNQPDKILEIKNGLTVIPVPVGNIVYIEVFNKVCIIHKKKNEFQAYTSLDGLFEQLDDDSFMRAQRSYIVNMRFIDSFFFDRIVLYNGIEITLSRGNRAELKNRYQRFLFNLARREGL